MLPFNKVGSKLRGERLNQVSFPKIKIMSILAKKKKIRQGKRLSLPPTRLIFDDVYLLIDYCAQWNDHVCFHIASEMYSETGTFL